MRVQNKLFEAALGIVKPWYVNGVDFDAAKKTMTYVDSPDKVERLHLEEVQQGRGPDLTPKKTKKRGMSM